MAWQGNGMGAAWHVSICLKLYTKQETDDDAGSQANSLVLEASHAVRCASYVQTIPVLLWTGPEGSRRLRLLYFKTFAT
jgi:hypothetical protein